MKNGKNKFWGTPPPPPKKKKKKKKKGNRKKNVGKNGKEKEKGFE